MVAIWIRALLYLLFVSGCWLVAMPAGVLAVEQGHWLPDLRAWALTPVGGGLFGTGFGLAVWAGFCLIRFGRGTPLPFDPPSRLVVRGPYRVVRNPQAIAMVLMVAGEVVAVRSQALWVMLPLTIAYLELLVGPWEERQLVRDFGDEYRSYARRVGKWLPRWRFEPPLGSGRNDA